MARRKKVTSKQCAMTGMTFPTNEFYANNNSKDGLHAYSKKADNFRRRLQATWLQSIGSNRIKNYV